MPGILGCMARRTTHLIQNEALRAENQRLAAIAEAWEKAARAWAQGFEPLEATNLMIAAQTLKEQGRWMSISAIGKQRQYAPAFKAYAVRLSTHCGVTEAARRLSIPCKTLRGWREQAGLPRLPHGGWQRHLAGRGPIARQTHLERVQIELATSYQGEPLREAPRPASALPAPNPADPADPSR